MHSIKSNLASSPVYTTVLPVTTAIDAINTSSSDILVIYCISEYTKKCPSCNVTLIDADIQRRRCMACHEYICYKYESAQDIVAIRKKANVYTLNLENPVRDIYKITKSEDNKKIIDIKIHYIAGIDYWPKD